MWRKIRMAVLIGICVVLGWMARTWCDSDWAGSKTQSLHTGPTIQQVQALSCLVTTKVDVADVVETRIRGETGGVQAVLIVKGDFLLGTDVSNARFETVDSQHKTAVLVLPSPAALSPRLDLSRTRLYTVNNNGLWLIVPGDQASKAVLNKAYGDAQKFVADVAGQGDLIEKSRRQAEQVLRAFFEAIGWDVNIRWAN